MHSTKSATIPLLLLVLSALTRCTIAQTLLIWTPSNASPPYIQEPPSTEEWETAFVSPNATGRFPVPGYNMTDTFPGSPSDDWTYTIQVRDDILLPDKTGYFTGTWIRLDAPKNLIVQSPFNESLTQVVRQDDSWGVCLNVYVGPEMTTSDPAAPGDGCEILSEECITDLENFLKTKWQNRSPDGIRADECPVVSPKQLPESCQKFIGTGAIGTNHGLREEVQPPPEYQTNFRPSNGTYDLWKFGSEADKHLPGNTTAYEQALRQVYIVGHIWGRRDGEVASASVSCLRAVDEVAVKEGGSGAEIRMRMPTAVVRMAADRAKEA
ncbi:hypothetical protein B0H66DRAFT_641778 [Apodospora peruviana]|uniref:Uncharacterized protein n=1 Tax=Apodospora peruviana TaxID=516989 RepID=A0AAE0I1Y8_9PEZI|nr:hypothetical protein B0H66DRAFT_641778 [Apodospora peruviana]